MFSPALSPLSNEDEFTRGVEQFEASGLRFLNYVSEYVETYRRDYELLGEEHLNIITAIQGSLSFSKKWNQIAQLVIVAYDYFRERGFWNELERLWEILFTASEGDMDIEHRMIITIHRATMAEDRGQFLKAITLLTQALNAAEMIDDHISEARILWHWGVLEIHQGHYNEAEAKLLQCRGICETLPLAPLTIFTQGQLANIALVRGDLDQAAKLTEACIPLWAELGEENGLTHTTLHSLGRIRAPQGRYLEAEKLLMESLSIKEKSSLPGKGHTLCLLGRVEIALRKYMQAQDHLAESLAIAQNLDDHRYITLSCMALAELAGKSGELETSSHYYFCAIEQGENGLSPEIMLEAYVRLAFVLAKRLHLFSAIRYFAKSGLLILHSQLSFRGLVLHGLALLKRRPLW